MTRSFIACHNFDLHLVFKVTSIIESFSHLEGDTKCHLWVEKIFITSVHTCIEDLTKIHQSGQFDLCQGHSSNGHFQWKSIGFHQNRHIVLRPLDPKVPHETYRHLCRILLGIPRIRSLHPISTFYGSKLNFSVKTNGINKCP